ncbi:hypothetical protein [Streptomyces sp. NPDC048338]|uniref:hypothetical protein n=1 Tax=Streptomyces sp. NPDC048338 TaxID=3365536 RepID=UPI0037208CD0
MRCHSTATKASIIVGTLTATLLWMPAGSTSAAPSLAAKKVASEASLGSNIVTERAAGVASRAEMIEIIKAEFKGTQNDAKAVRVADCESNLNPRVIDHTGRFYGLFQLRRDVFDDLGGRVGGILDAKENSRIAYIAFKKLGGWQFVDPACSRA